jgi:hypothetical protein
MPFCLRQLIYVGHGCTRSRDRSERGWISKESLSASVRDWRFVNFDQRINEIPFIYYVNAQLPLRKNDLESTKLQRLRKFVYH